MDQLTEQRAAISSRRANSYRPDIDGLRAIAVLSVLFYHLGFQSFAGGYVGVDVFFVISGYLITRIIRDEVTNTGRFSYPSFYARRIRRLFPALFVTIAASFFAALYLFTPEDLRAFGHSAVAAIFSVSNFYFWSVSGYFDTAAITKPLLHTWSLSVEEQFYYVWPVLIALSLPRLGQLRMRDFLAVLGIVSFAASVYWSNDRSLIFYLLPFRVFELALGGLLNWVPVPDDKRPLELLLLLGLGLIAYSIATYDPSTVFPSWAGIPPCAGAALAIYAGQSPRLGRVLTNPVSVEIGLISYSLYLVHWPLIVFATYVNGDLSIWNRLSICVVAIALAIAMYFLIEKPFRYGRGRRRVVFLSAAASMALVAIPSGMAATGDGWRWRYSPEIAKLLDKNQFIEGPKALQWDCFVRPGKSYTSVPKECYTIRNHDRPNILVMGDSTANALMPGIVATLGKDANIYQWATASCPPIEGYKTPDTPSCAANNLAFFSKILPANKYDLVIFSNHWHWDQMARGFPHTVAIMRSHKIPFVMLGQTINFTDSTQNLVAKHGTLAGLGDFMKRHMGVAKCDGNEEGLNALVPSTRFFSMKRILCDGSVPIYRQGDWLIHQDNLHFSRLGSLYVAQKLAPWVRSRFPID